LIKKDDLLHRLESVDIAEFKAYGYVNSVKWRMKPFQELLVRVASIRVVRPNSSNARARHAAIVSLRPLTGQWFQSKPQQKYRKTLGHLAAFLLTAMRGLLDSNSLSPAYASSQLESPTQQLLEQQKKIEETIVSPCKSERAQKAAEIRESIATCPCSAAQRKQETDELEATLKIEMRRCEQKGVDALDQFKHALVAHAQDDFNRFSGQVEMDRQILQNFGFQRTVDEMESWTHYSEKAQKEYTRQAQDEVIGKFFQSIHLRAQEMAATPQITRQRAVSLYNLFKTAGVKDQALFGALAAAGRGDPQIPERMLWEKITAGVEKLNDAREVVQTEDQALNIFNSMLDVAGWLAPELAPELSIVKDASWIGYATYTHGEVVYGLHKVDRLTALTEAQLQDLEPVTRRLKQDVDGLVAAKKVLKWAAASSGSTSLVRPD